VAGIDAGFIVASMQGLETRIPEHLSAIAGIRSLGRTRFVRRQIRQLALTEPSIFQLKKSSWRLNLGNKSITYSLLI
jgi:hypothetical protein